MATLALYYCAALMGPSAMAGLPELPAARIAKLSEWQTKGAMKQVRCLKQALRAGGVVWRGAVQGRVLCGHSRATRFGWA